MSPLEMIAGFDVLAWSVVLGTLGFLGGLIWVLVEDRPIQDRLRAGTGPAEGKQKLPHAPEGPKPVKPKAPRASRAA